MATEGPTGRRIAALAARQHGVVAHRQLLELGLGERAIARWCAAGLLHPVFRGVYAFGNPAVGRMGRILAAVLACAPAVASHGTAAELLGLSAIKGELIDVIPRTDAGRGIDGIRWHRVPFPEPGEIVDVAGIPCTDPSRTIVDLAGSRRARTLRALIEEAAVAGVLDPEAILAKLARHRRLGAPLLRTLLEPWRGTAANAPLLRSRLEARLLGELLDRGFPRPDTNRVLALGDRRLEVDFVWPDRRVVVETDGARYHGTEPARARDRARDRLLSAAGYRVIRVTWAELDEQPERFFLDLRRALAENLGSGGS